MNRAAIAFENARLYRSLQTEILERQQAETMLQDTNQRKDEFLAMRRTSCAIRSRRSAMQST